MEKLIAVLIVYCFFFGLVFLFVSVASYLSEKIVDYLKRRRKGGQEHGKENP